MQGDILLGAAATASFIVGVAIMTLWSFRRGLLLVCGAMLAIVANPLGQDVHRHTRTDIASADPRAARS